MKISASVTIQECLYHMHIENHLRTIFLHLASTDYQEIITAGITGAVFARQRPFKAWVLAWYGDLEQDVFAVAGHLDWEVANQDSGHDETNLCLNLQKNYLRAFKVPHPLFELSFFPTMNFLSWNSFLKIEGQKQ